MHLLISDRVLLAGTHKLWVRGKAYSWPRGMGICCLGSASTALAVFAARFLCVVSVFQQWRVVAVLTAGSWGSWPELALPCKFQSLTNDCSSALGGVLG